MLWRVGGGKSMQAEIRLECPSQGRAHAHMRGKKHVRRYNCACMGRTTRQKHMHTVPLILATPDTFWLSLTHLAHPCGA